MAERVAPDRWRARVERARTDGYTFLNDLTAVDEIAASTIRVLLRLEDPRHGAQLDLATEVDREAPRLDGIASVFPGAAWLQRQVHDLFGVEFSGDDRHPLIVHGGGAPLRKDALLAPRIERRWPGALEPGQAQASPSGRKLLPPGVPDPAVAEDPATTPAEVALSATGTRVRRRR